MGSVVDDTDMSDDNQLYVTCAFNDLGYIVHFKLLNACDAGLPQSRRRVYMIAIRMPSVESATPKHPLLRDVEAAYEGLGQVACPNLADFLLGEVNPAAQSCLMKRLKREDDSNLWAISHSKLYNEAGLHWPPEALPHEAQLGRRRAEIIFLVENTMDGSEAEQCFDISQAALRVGFATAKTCCLTPGAEVWLRNEGRLLKGEEALRIQGFWLADRQRLAAFSDFQLRDLAGMLFRPVAWAVLCLFCLLCCEAASGPPRSSNHQLFVGLSRTFEENRPGVCNVICRMNFRPDPVFCGCRCNATRGVHVACCGSDHG